MECEGMEMPPMEILKFRQLSKQEDCQKAEREGVDSSYVAYVQY